MSVDQIGARVDQSMSKSRLCSRNFIAPVTDTMDRYQLDIAWLFVVLDVACHAVRGLFGKRFDEVQAWLAWRCRPIEWDSAGRRGESEYKNTAAHAEIYGHRCACLRKRASGAGMMHARPVEGNDRFLYTGISPIQNVIVCKTTAIDAGCRDATDIRRIHAIVDALQ